MPRPDPDDPNESYLPVIVEENGETTLSHHFLEADRYGEELRQEARAKATRAAYAVAWGAFERWCAAGGEDARLAPPRIVADYLAAMERADRPKKKDGTRGYAPATIVQAATAIADVLRRYAPGSWPYKKWPPEVAATIAAVYGRHGKAPKRRKKAIEDRQLAQMLPTMGVGLRGLRNRAIVLCTFWLAMRRSELVALDVADVVIDDWGLRTTTRRSKTDQLGEGFDRGVPHLLPVYVCPACALRAWLDAAGIEQGPIARAMRGGVVSAKRLQPPVVLRIVQAAAAAVGLQPSEFGAHSLRAGFITTAKRDGVPLDDIMRHTGHKTAAVAASYVRFESVKDNNPIDAIRRARGQ